MSGQQSPATGEGSFAPVKGSLAAIIGLSLLGAASSVVPFIAIVELARALLPALEGGQIDAGRVRGIVLVAIGALLVSLVAAFTSGMVAHLASIHR